MQCLSCPALISYLTCRGKRTTKCNVKLWMQFHTVFKGSIFRWVIVIWLVCTVLMNSPCYPGPMVYGICFCPVSRKEQLKDLKVAGRPSPSTQARVPDVHLRPTFLTLAPPFLTFTPGHCSSRAYQASAPHVHIRLVLLTCVSGPCSSQVHQAHSPHMHSSPHSPVCLTAGRCLPQGV